MSPKRARQRTLPDGITKMMQKRAMSPKLTIVQNESLLAPSAAQPAANAPGQRRPRRLRETRPLSANKRASAPKIDSRIVFMVAHFFSS